MTRDEELKNRIKDVLSENLANTAWGINVQVEKGYVTLQGVVDTLAEKEKAAQILQGLSEIKGIDNSLAIALDSYRTDEEITRLVEEKLRREPRIDLKKIGAECDKGVVILRGQASSLGEIELARELAAQVPGVREVRELVKFTEEAKDVDNASLVNGVEVAFSTSDLVEAEDVVTSCQDGVITLEGTVDTKEQKEAAEVIAKTVPGVKKVINRLKTRKDSTQGDEYLTNVLRRALREDGRVGPGQVKAFVVDGVAFLSGQVFSIDTKKAAEEVARKVDGITRVVNDITVAYH